MAKIRKTRYSPILCINSLTYQSFTVSGMRNAEKVTGVDRRKISAIIKNAIPSHNGWVFGRPNENQ